MCLSIRSKILTATEPITVYKELIRSNGKFVGPFRQKCEYKKGETKSVRMFGLSLFSYDPISLFLNFLGKFVILEHFVVNEGLHSYKNKRYSRWKDVLVECTIPVGARYILGTDDVVSTKLIVGEAIGGRFAELFNLEG